MKRVSALIVSVMIAVFSIPQLRVHASNDGVVGVYTQESIGTVFSDSTLQSKLSNILLTNEQVNTYDIFSIMENASFSFSPSDILFAVFNSGGGWIVETIDVPADVNFIYYTAGSSARSGYFYAINNNSSQEVSGRTPVTGHGITNSGVESTITSTLVAYYPWGSGQQGILAGDAVLLYSPIPVVSQDEAVSMGAPSSGGTLYNWLLANYESLTDVRGSGAVFNGTDIVNPSEPEPEIEDISNHLYAKDFDIFFAQSSTNMTNGAAFDSIGGGYLVFKYTLDDYAKTHINDMFLSVNYSVHFDNEQFTGAYQGRLDPSGYTIISLKDAFQNDPYWAKTHYLGLFVQKNAFYQNFYKMDIMSFSTDTWAQLYSYANNNSGGSAPTNMAGAIDNYVKGLLNKYTGFYFGYDGNGVVEGLYDFWDALRANMIENPGSYQSAYFTGTAILQNNADILNTSGSFTNKIDFKTGITSVIDNGITINENPFEDISPYEVAPYSPDDVVQYGSNGGAYATVGNIVNQITIPGYKELKADLDTNPDGNFTQFLAPFYNNEVGAWFFSFVDDMPPEMKAILISGCGVGVLFGIARYVRRS